jgi:membrane protein implicated in regulation of membrane protease activity
MLEESPFTTGDDPKGLNWADKARFQKIFTKQAVNSYVFLSFGMGVVALMLPILLVLAGGYDGNYSISWFYHASDATRNIMVGSLCAIGAFLFLYHGLSNLENWVLNIAGVAAVCIAWIPMGPTQACGGGISLHLWSAIVFFVCLSIVAVLLSKGRLSSIIYPPRRRQFKRAYNLAGTLMIAMPAGVAAIHFSSQGSDCKTHWVFWVETFGTWAFSFFWFVKTLEHRTLLGIK